MSAINDFLIKRAVMEKEAINALGRRLMTMSDPVTAIKRYGKKRVDGYLKDISTASSNFKDSDRKSGTLLSMFRTAAKYPGEQAPLVLMRKELAPTLENAYGIIPRDTLIQQINKIIPGYDTSKLAHQNYVIGAHHRLSDKDMLMAATQLPYTDSIHLPVQRAVLRDIQLSRSMLGDLSKAKNSSIRSVKKALASVEGQNILEPGTYANRLFNKIYARPKLRKKLGLPGKFDLWQYKLAQNAMYSPAYNVIAVSPKYGKNYDVVRAHELGHFTSYNAPADAHAAHAYPTLRRMKAVANKNNFKLPLDNDQLMQEVIAESYIPKILGKHVTSPRSSYLSNAITDIGLLPAVLQNRKNFFQLSRNKYAIDKMKGTEADKELFRQLALNYGYNLL